MTARPSLASIAEAVSRKPRKPRDGNAEARVQASIVDWIRTVAPQCIVFHVPNGGLRSKPEAARLKWTGVLPGIPDLVVLAPHCETFFIECKSPVGRLEGEQEAMIFKLSSLGFTTAVCRSIDDAQLAFKAWDIPTREAA